MPTEAEPTIQERQPVSTRRLEAFTDGVFAIAATLLVLDISTEGFEAVRSDDAMWHALSAVLPSVLNFALSFVLLALLWTVHVRQFEYITRVDSRMLWLNAFRLLGVVFVPFATSLNDDFSNYLAGRMLLPLTFLWVVALGTVQWAYASSPNRDFLSGMTAGAVRAARAGGWAAVIIALGVVLLSSMIGSFAFFLFALNPLISAVLKRREAGRTAAA